MTHVSQLKTLLPSRLKAYHYSNVSWELWRPKSLTTQVFGHQLVKLTAKDIKALHYWPGRESADKPGTLLLIILILVCKYDVKGVHGKLLTSPIRYSKRESTDGNTQGDVDNAEKVSHTFNISYKMNITDIRYETTSARKGQRHRPPVPKSDI